MADTHAGDFDGWMWRQRFGHHQPENAERRENHAENMAKAALEIRLFLEERNQQNPFQWKIRIGLHSGKVVGGVVGVKKYIYDVFGDTINTTSRMESNSEPMRINVSETTFRLLQSTFRFTHREPMEIKGKGLMRMYFLESYLSGFRKF